jgi:hypothetical protein
MTDTKIVTFKKEWRGYAIGEIAGFDSEAAASLIKSGRATAYVAPVASEKAPPGAAGKNSASKKGGKAAESTDPVDPVDPIDPVDPEAPEEPDEKP